MGTLTLSEMEDELRANLTNRTDLDTRLDRLLNVAQMRIARIRDWEELKFLKSNTTEYTPADSDKYLAVPDNLRKVFSLRLIDGTNSLKLVQKTARYFDDHIPAPEQYTKRRPEYYIRWSERLEFWPVPDAAYSLLMRGTVWPTWMSDSSDTSTLDNKDDLIINLATNIAKLSIGRTDDAKIFWTAFTSGLRNAVNEDVPDSDLDIVFEDKAAGVPEYFLDPFVRQVR